MNSEIIDKISMIQKGIVPEGYKKTLKANIVPNEWESVKFDKCVEITKGQVNPKEKHYCNMVHIGLANIEKRTGRLLYTNIAKDEDLVSSKYYFEKDTILYGKIRPELGKVIYADFEGICSADIYPLKPLKNLNPRYLKYLIMDDKFYKFSVSASMRTGMPKINREDISTSSFILPNINEQEEISKVLDIWEKIIELKEKLLQEKQKQKKGLMERLLTGKVRLNGFDDKIKISKLKNYILEIKEKNKDNKETTILSVTNRYGFILQEEQFERIVASSDVSNYKIVKKGQFAYNPSRVNVGSLDLLKRFDSGLLSPMYVIFECKESLNIEYLYQFLKSDLFLNYIPRLLQGSVRDSLSFDALQQVNLFIPSLEEQKQIGNFLKIADEQLDLLKKEIELLKEQKKGLMQLLLTGIVRVKCD